MILVRCTTKVPSLVKFGQILQEITGVGKFTHPPQPTYMPDAPQDRVKKERELVVCSKNQGYNIL